MQPKLKPLAILTGDVKKAMSELKLDHIWIHRGVVRGTGENGPVCIFPVNNPVAFKGEPLDGLFIHPSAQSHPRLQEYEDMVMPWVLR